MAITKINTPELFDLGSTNTSLQLPSGNTASRPSSPSTGEWRFNTDDNKVEYWDGSAWTTIEDEGIAPTASEHFNVNTYVGSGATQTIDAKFNEAAVFNGSSSKIVLPDSTEGIGETDSSFSFWVNPESVSTGYGIVCLLTHNDWIEIRYNSSGQFQIYPARQSNGTYIAFSAVTRTAKNWYNIVITRDSATSTIKLYIDSTLIETNTSWDGTLTSAPSDPNGIGANVSSNTLNFSGKLDQIRFFNTALTQQQVTDLYTNETTDTAGTLNFPSGAGCVAAYQLDGDASDVGGTYGGIPTDLGFVGLKFQPDLVWIKNRDQADNHILSDAVRGINKPLVPNLTNSEGTGTGYITSYDSTGFTLGSQVSVNTNNEDYVAWCFKGGGTAVSNTDGSITSTVSANQDAGFSIVKYTGNGSTGTIGHGLSSAPEMMIIKNLDQSDGWAVYTSTTGSGQFMQLNESFAAGGAGDIFGTPNDVGVSPTSTVFTIGSNHKSGANGEDYIAYCFHSVDGYSKIGSYTGTGAAGNFVETGFQPAFLMVKNITDANDWIIVDNKRSTENPRNEALHANENRVEYTNDTYYTFDFLSNGFEMNGTTGSTNASGKTYIYLAIAADPDTTTPTVENSFDVVTYTGDGTTSQIIDVDFKPDLVWVKDRDINYAHQLYDTVRGATEKLHSNTTAAEATDSTGLTAFTENGFTVSTNVGINTSGNDYVAWCWKAAGIGAINTEGSITSIANANQAAGFSIVKYTSTASTSTIGHGLSAAPELMILKSTTNTGDWQVYSSATGNTKKLILNSSSAASTSAIWNNTSPTSTVFTSAFNNVGDVIAYCFHSVSGYQKIGSYTGTGSSGNSVTTGFRPRFVMVKKSSGTANWVIKDSQRDSTNPNSANLYPNLSNAENTVATLDMDFDDNGFTLDGTSGDVNGSSATYIYLAIK